MRIGIDIDDTLTDIKDKLTYAAMKYAITLNKVVEKKKYNIDDIYNNGNIYQKLFGFNYDELKYFLGNIQEKITDEATPRKNCVETINKMHSQGHEIYIITARDTEFHKDPYLQSKTWLEKNNIYFDKLIINARDKAKACLDNNIDLLIDDGISNCEKVNKCGIETIRIGNERSYKRGINTFSNWLEIYEYINTNKFVKIVEYKEKYKDEICNFINKSMHDFIGRPYKDRPDVSNINDYYIKNNGNFWLAIDIDSNKIVGSIAIENRKSYGILKRLYVDKDYQKLGIGQRLYNILDDFVINKTEFKEVYLVCGQVLKDAHRFYLKQGFKQVNGFEIEMHYAQDDDFFIKTIEREIKDE